MAVDVKDPDLEELLRFLKASRGFDATVYKRASLARRIDRRLQARKVTTYADYRELLEGDDAEFVELFNTILINVTAFFRDTFAWDYLREEIVPRILDGDEPGPIRVWSTGCATGEEAFSLAIVFAELIGKEEYKQRVKIYATDLDDRALNAGRHAIYTPKQIEPVTPELREKYFRQTNG